MLVDLSEKEVQEIVKLVGPGEIFDKLTAKPHPDTELFRHVAGFHDDYTHIPFDAVVDRTRNGAYVQAWLWVYNEKAGFTKLTDFSDYGISEQTRERLNDLREFNVDDTGDLDVVEGGTVDGREWTLELEDGVWTIRIAANEKSGADWRHTVLSTNKEFDLHEAFLVVLAAIERFRSEDPVNLGSEVSHRL